MPILLRCIIKTMLRLVYLIVPILISVKLRIVHRLLKLLPILLSIYILISWYMNVLYKLFYVSAHLFHNFKVIHNLIKIMIKDCLGSYIIKIMFNFLKFFFMKKETAKTIINLVCTVLSAIAAAFCGASCTGIINL